MTYVLASDDTTETIHKNVCVVLGSLILFSVIMAGVVWMLHYILPDGLTSASYGAAALVVYSMMQFTVSEYGYRTTPVTCVRVLFLSVSFIAMIPIMQIQEHPAFWYVLVVLFVAVHIFRAPPARDGAVCRMRKKGKGYVAYRVPSRSWFFHTWLMPYAQPRYYNKNAAFTSRILLGDSFRTTVAVTLKADIEAYLPSSLEERSLLSAKEKEINAILVERLRYSMPDPQQLLGQDICHARVSKIAVQWG